MGSAFAESKEPSRKPANNSFNEARGLTSREMISGDEVYAETETFLVRSTKVAQVIGAMDKLGLSEDVDFAWLNKLPNAKIVNFVCYSSDCHEWAKNRLRVITKAPARPEEALGLQWKDPSLESKHKEIETTEDEKIKIRHQLRYTRARAG